MTIDLLSENTAVAYLRDARVLAAAERAHVTRLAGGVSNIVLLVESANRRLVLKQSLPQLRVSETWLATTERTVNEAQAIALVHSRTPQAVPEVLHTDAYHHAVVISAAPQHWTDWKQHLMAGVVSPQVGRVLGDLLGRWHTELDMQDACEAGLLDPTAFDQLRIDPYYRASAHASSTFASAMLTAADELTSARSSLVHGDFSPKNVLVGEKDQVCVIDFEVAHWGNPIFDVAFLISHLAIKTVHIPQNQYMLYCTAEQFWSAYQARVPGEFQPETQLARHVAALMVARVLGKSPVDYLTPSEQQSVLRCAEAMFASNGPTISGLWFSLTEGTRQ